MEIVHQTCFTSAIPKLKAKNIDLGYEGVETAWIKGEPILLAERCANLIDNAIKYTPANGVVTVRVVSSDDHLHWVLECEDSGPGIPDAKINCSMEASYCLNNALGKLWLAGAGA